MPTTNVNQTSRPLVPVAIGGKRHVDLLRAGFRTHHVDGRVTWLQHPKDVRPTPILASRLFAGCFPTGISYADKSIEEHGDYKRVAFLPYRSLELEVSDPGSPLLPMVREAAAKIQARRGEQFQVSMCGQTVLLGG